MAGLGSLSEEESMDSIKDDAFETASRRLERLAQLKEKNLLEETEYQNIRNNILSEMTSCTKFHEAKTPAVQKPTEPLESPSLSYGHLHSEIVRKIEATHKAAGENAKQRVFKAMTEMAEKQALYPGDSAILSELVEIVFGPAEGGEVTNVDPAWKLLETQRLLIEISAKTTNSKVASPAAKAIAETSLHSAARATTEFSGEQKKPAGPGKLSLASFWGKFVLKDVEGAFEGGAAAVTIAPSFTATFPITLPFAAAFGVVVGAGIKSASAYTDRGA
jgi:hypothetical protein